ncbi:MAG: hypothetical protein HS108_03920 [Planctomycetes bacterium]|jgi:uncharacterized protein YciI|nr:hypothetical protein [Planctomycetota bacterium]MCL4731138.1 hypothetical protein [Planctomycetota bacterium]
MPIFVVTIDYLRPLEEIEAATADHRAWLRGLLDDGRLLASGPFVPRSGGMLLVRTKTQDELEQLIQGDPFAKKRLVMYTIREWNPVLGAERLA